MKLKFGSGKMKEGERQGAVTNSADDDILHAPECIYDLGLGYRSPKIYTGQTELENVLRGRFEGSPLFRLDDTRGIYQDLLERAAKQGVLR